MTVLLAFISVVFIWGTTPLALQWSIDHINFLFAVMARMVLGLTICLVAYGVTNSKIPLHKKAIFTYIAGGVGIFGAMTITYWAAQFIPSGWISVIFGLSTIMTGIMAYFWLNEPFGLERWVGLLFGVFGLSIIFIQGTTADSQQTVWGIGAILLSTFIYTVSSVAVKKYGGSVPALATTTGSLVVAVPCFLAVWMVDGGQMPQQLSLKVATSIIYLGIMGSVVGFVLYYFILQNMDASKAMLTTLLAPVVALFLGTTLNGEVVNGRIIFGTGMILMGLSAYQWGGVLVTRFSKTRI
ncbi:MAG: DMT family transporter [Magnetococcales bacterium]|nr:DMT family transporter [Magnetococcales bacterium]